MAMTASSPFQVSRKLGKTHQNVLIFIKGDPKKAAEEFGEVDANFEL